jgi:hypothetical protein
MFVTGLASRCKIDGSEAVDILGYVTPNLRSYVNPSIHDVLILDYVDSYYICDESVRMGSVVSQKEMICFSGQFRIYVISYTGFSRLKFK